MNRRTLIVLVGAVVVTMAAMGDRVARAQEGCPPGQVCNAVPCAPPPPPGDFLVLQETSDCTTEVAVFTPTMDTWLYMFDVNNAIKIGTDVSSDAMACPLMSFELRVDKIRISQMDYATIRRDPKFADTVCNPTFAPPSTDCVFYRVHGEAVPRSCYGAKVEYKIFWNEPPIQGNKHDWMLLRAPCDEFSGDTTPCDGPPFGSPLGDPPFSQDISLFVDRKPPVGTDPVVGGDADGMSDYIVAISTKHPHKGIPSMPF